MLPHLQRALEGTRERHPSGGPGGEPADSDLRGLRPERQPGCVPQPGDATPLELDTGLVEETLVSFIRDEVVRRRGFERVVVGVSGGVDSAVSLVLATRALGPDNVHGFRLPYRTSSQDSLDHARMILEATGAQAHTIDITGAVDGYIGVEEADISPQRRGNLAARLRAVTLFDQSAKLHALPLGTGNKSERLLGYYTWHADDSPPINPLGDLFKTQVWALARHLGVPAEIVEKPASADLIKGVHDEDELGISYHRADPILHWFLHGYGPEELVDHGFDADEVGLVWRRLNATHWKRELPTVAVLSSSAIGEFYLRPVDY
jgi:NAD+ synthase